MELFDGGKIYEKDGVMPIYLEIAIGRHVKITTFQKF
jgi:hypothetical protein